MICIAGNMPIIQVGDYQVAEYDTFWIRRAIENAAIRADQEHFAFVDDVYDGIVYYLEHKCPLRLLELETLYDRIRHTLKRIGCEAIANSIQPESPPITLSLEHIAIEASTGYELAFYQRLKDEMGNLKKMGVKEVFFSQVRESIMVLKQTNKWSEECDQLEHDILGWLKKEGTKPERLGKRIRVSLKKVAL